MIAAPVQSDVDGVPKGSHLRSLHQEVEEVRGGLGRWLDPVSIDLPAGAGELSPMRRTPSENRGVRFAEAVVAADMRRRGDWARRGARADDAIGAHERSADLHPTFQGDRAIEIHGDVPAGLGELGCASELPRLAAERWYDSGELSLWNPGPDHGNELR